MSIEMTLPGVSNIAMGNGGVGMVEFGSDARLYVEFYMRPVLQGFKSEQAGLPVYEAVPHIKIIQPGERDIIDRPANDMDKARFRDKWRAFEEGREAKMDGTPLAVLFPNKPEIVLMFQHLHVLTVQQLANLSDTQLQNVGLGGREFQDMARKFLDTAEKGVEFHALKRDLENKNDEINQLKAQVQALVTRVQELEADDDEPRPSRPRGRPRKQEN